MDMSAIVQALRGKADQATGMLGRGMAYGTRNIKTSLPEALRNYVDTAGWKEKKDAQDFYGGDFEAQERADRMMGFGTDAGGLVGAIKASHGTPHAFDKFDMSKIGTGEGAQAYGHGLYFAQGFDSPVAKEYREKLSNKGGVNAFELRGVPMALWDTSGIENIALGSAVQHESVDKAINGLRKNANEYPNRADKWLQAADYLESNKDQIKLLEKPGHLYNVSLEWPNAAREAADPLGEHHLLDWDKPLSGQSEAVQKALSKYAIPDKKMSGQEIKSFLQEIAADESGLSGTSPDFYKQFSSKASALLRNAGIPGIKYLDQGSRGAGAGTSNYVIFDDEIPKIISRNGIPVGGNK